MGYEPVLPGSEPGAVSEALLGPDYSEQPPASLPVGHPVLLPTCQNPNACFVPTPSLLFPQ